MWQMDDTDEEAPVPPTKQDKQVGRGTAVKAENSNGIIRPGNLAGLPNDGAAFQPRAPLQHAPSSRSRQ